jgi:hypothetical protein
MRLAMLPLAIETAIHLVGRVRATSINTAAYPDLTVDTGVTNGVLGRLGDCALHRF